MAVKTKIGQKNGADAKPGQRKVDTKLPDGSTFDGNVQGMGFRFKVDEWVGPKQGILKIDVLAPVETTTVATSDVQLTNSWRLFWLVAGLSVVGLVFLLRSRQTS